VSVWNKPLKFYISTTILFCTIAWIMADQLSGIARQNISF
jgi:hypothetical protein